MDSKQTYYANNKERYRQNTLRQRAEKKEYLKEYKNRPCMMCGIQYPHFVMELHHREPEKKEGYINATLRGKSWNALITEVNKCDVLCANCHRLVEYGGATY